MTEHVSHATILLSNKVGSAEDRQEMQPAGTTEPGSAQELKRNSLGTRHEESFDARPV
jgi:hypothetical protein